MDRLGSRINGNSKAHSTSSDDRRSSTRHRRTLLVLSLLLSGGLNTLSTTAQAAPTDSVRPATVEESRVLSTETAIGTQVEREHWRKSLLQKPKPRKGCFTATFPDTEWKEVQCKEPPHKPYPPRNDSSTRVDTVGNTSGDFSAQVTGHITQAEGSFDSVTTTGESNSSGVANAYSLQINTDFFQTSVCNGTSGGSNCRGWEQFVYDSGGDGFIQYWLINAGPANSSCPMPQSAHCDGAHVFTDGWCPFQIGSSTDCAVNAASSVPAPAVTATNLHQIVVNGAAAGVNGNADDSIFVAVNGTVQSASGGNRFPDLGSHWQTAEFNVFGDGGGDAANFNANTTLVVRTSVDSGTTAGPNCDFQSFTGETNNLILTSTTEVPSITNFPSLVFTESNVAGTTPVGCAQAISVGDTHITTFDGLHYDFQAAGDFVLVDDGAGFVVQARQSSGAPTWPNAAVNKAVSAQMGRTRMSVLVEPTRLEIDGAERALADGAVVKLPDGVQVSRHGNVYIASDDHGNRMRVTANSAWLDIQVLLGNAPHTNARGLLGNPKGNARTLATRSGVLLTEPVGFKDLYETYGNSWRVEGSASLFTKVTPPEISNPAKPIFAKNLPAPALARARTVCQKAGVKNKDLLEDCILDSAVLNDRAVTEVFVHAPVRLKATIRPVVNAHVVDSRTNR